MTIFVYAWTGLILGLLSLLEIQNVLVDRISKKYAWPFTFTLIGLSGIGVFMGRFQRWNSWDIFFYPGQVIQEITHVLTHPLAYLNTFGLALVVAVLMLLAYLTFFTLLENQPK